MKKPFQKINEFSKRNLRTLFRTVSFLFSLLIFVVFKIVGLLGILLPAKIRNRLVIPCKKIYINALARFGKGEAHTINRVSLIELAFKNMNAKRARALVTIGGMAVGISAIVFLVSIGYGLQELVISRVVKLEEMKQADVSRQMGSKLEINDWVINRLKEVQNVSDALPMISVVGTVSFQNSVSDMAAYGVTADYLKNSAIRPVHGKVFDSNETVVEISHQSEDGELFSEETFSEEMDDEINVAGVQTDSSVQCVYGEELMDVEFSIHPGKWLRVRESASASSEIIGYTRRVEGTQTGKEVAGLKYASDDGRGSFGKDEDGTELGKWISAKVLLWQKTPCNAEDEIDCVQGKFVVLRDKDGAQIQQNGFIAEINLNVNDIGDELSVMNNDEEEPIVKGEKVAQADFIDASKIDWTDLGTEIVGSSNEDNIVEITTSTQKEVVVNRSTLKILNINENEAVGKIFQVSFSAIGELLEDSEKRIKSAPTDYKIVGVTPDEGSPLLYVPFIDLRSMGINNYSQVKVIANSKESLGNIRKNVEAMGFVTSSVVDTVNQISDLFAKVRLVLVLVGMIALAVASLGMFNTLTVSLLERTREVGLMKAMGMKSVEVWELFLVESILMGFLGGILGIIIGFVAGKLLGVFLSFFSMFKGAGVVDVTYLPPFFVITVLVLSLVVGIGTGIYPAKRAKKISALNALRYE